MCRRQDMSPKLYFMDYKHNKVYYCDIIDLNGKIMYEGIRAYSVTRYNLSSFERYVLTGNYTCDKYTFTGEIFGVQLIEIPAEVTND